MAASLLGEWTDFGVGAAGAAAALAGLVFVALSINLARILTTPELPRRAAETIIVLGAALVSALLMLIPARDSQALGLCAILVGLTAWALPTQWQVRAFFRREHLRLSYAVWRFILHQLATLPLVIGPALLLASVEAQGLHWLAAGIIAAMVIALINAWVLLVEIMR